MEGGCNLPTEEGRKAVLCGLTRCAARLNHVPSQFVTGDDFKSFAVDAGRRRRHGTNWARQDSEINICIGFWIQRLFWRHGGPQNNK
jgi:hypothetical protein